MAVTQNLPSNTRRPVVAHTFDDISGARGQQPLDNAIALVGTQSAAGTAPVEEPTQVFNEADADTKAGQGTFLAIMARTVFATLRKLGKPNAVAVYIVPIADPAGTAAQNKITTGAGTASEAGDVVFRICGRTFRAGVSSGDDQDAVTQAIVDAVNARKSEVPVTAAVNGVNANEADLDAVVTGVNGEDIDVVIDEAPGGLSITATAPIAGVGVIDDTNALDSLLSKHFFSVALENHTSTALTDLESHMDDAWAAIKKRFRHGFVCERGTVSAATTLASGVNRKEIVVVGYENARSFNGELAAAVGAARLTSDRPSKNYDFTELAVFGPDPSDVFIDSELETLLAGGVTPLITNDQGETEIVRLVTTKTTENSAPFENLLDLSNSWVLPFNALQLDPRLKAAIKGENLDEEKLNELRNIVYAGLKESERLGDLQNVDQHKDAIIVEAHLTIPTRALIEIPQSVVPNAHQVDATHILIVEGASA